MKFTNQKIENMQNVLTVIGNKEIDNPVLALKIARNNYNLTADTVDNITNDNGQVDGDAIDGIHSRQIIDLENGIIESAYIKEFQSIPECAPPLCCLFVVHSFQGFFYAPKNQLRRFFFREFSFFSVYLDSCDKFNIFHVYHLCCIL